MAVPAWFPSCLLLVFAVVAPEGGPQAGSEASRSSSAEQEVVELAPGIWIRRSAADPEAMGRRERFETWKSAFQEQMSPVRGASTALFEALERSSLAAQTGRCERLLMAVAQVDRELVLPAPEIRLERSLLSTLERYRSGAVECLVGRYVVAFRLLEEARAGLEGIDGRIESRLRAPVRLPGLGEPQRPPD